jgi:hypothetical protein
MRNWRLPPSAHECYSHAANTKTFRRARSKTAEPEMTQIKVASRISRIPGLRYPRREQFI